MDKHYDSQVPAVLKTFAILEYLLDKNDATIKEISKHCNISQASTTRIVKTLTNLNYLKQTQDKTASSYKIGLGFLKFYQKAQNSIDLESIASLEMKKLSRKINQTSQLAILDGYNVIYTLAISTNVQVGVAAPINSPLPINVSAGGKVICAFLSEESKLDIIKNADLPPYTEHTITDKMELLLHLAKIKKQGYAFDNEEYAQGICCLAAPIFNHLGNIVAAVGVTGPSLFYSPTDNFDSIRDSVIETANNISKKLGK